MPEWGEVGLVGACSLGERTGLARQQRTCTEGTRQLPRYFPFQVLPVKPEPEDGGKEGKMLIASEVVSLSEQLVEDGGETIEAKKQAFFSELYKILQAAITKHHKVRGSKERKCVF